MARVYHVYDELAEREVALKLWWPGTHRTPDHSARQQSIISFEYEYRTLAQLRHPRVIEVYDYGLHERGPFFTMELLDGGDLRERAPLPWREACHTLYDVCSSLALLHSRRLIHRDVSPRNVRCTRHGTAKLIDFGAMRPMGSCQQVVGTPAFAAPEVVQGLPLDGRVDLFSLGATLYFALTGRQPSAARTFAEVLPLAQHKPPPPSRFAPDVPPALDSLVLSLLDPDPALRPRTAFEVMQRLASIARIENREPLGVAQAYLSTPELVGRDDVLARIRERSKRAMAGHGGSVFIEGEDGMGRSRTLDVCELWMKTQGASMLRCNGAVRDALDNAVTRALLEQLVDALPSGPIYSMRGASPDFDALFEPEPAHEDTAVVLQTRRAARLRASLLTSELPRKRLRSAVVRALLDACEHTPLVIAVDDAHACDTEAIALLTELAQRAVDTKLLLLLLHAPVSTSASGGPPMLEHAAFRHARRAFPNAELLQLIPLSLDQTRALLGSVFGDVPNLALLSARVHAVAAGNPGDTIDIAQWLVDRGTIRYDAGSWALPSGLEVTDLPACAEGALRARLERLSPLARELACTHALALREGFTRAGYRVLAGGFGSTEVDAAIAELSCHRVIAAERGTYTITHSTWNRILREGDSATLQLRHSALASYYLHTGSGPLHLVHHLLCAGKTRAALAHVVAALQQSLGARARTDVFGASELAPEQVASVLARCLSAMRDHERPAREEHLLRRWLCMLSVVTRDEYYLMAAPAWRGQLERATGLTFLRAATGKTSPRQRVREAMALAQDDYARTPGQLRVSPPHQALKQLVEYVCYSLVIGARSLDTQLIDSLPELLEPFAALSPEIELTYQLALATQLSLCRCQIEQARARWLDLHARLPELDRGPAGGDERTELPALSLPHRAFMRAAVAYAIGASEATLGMQSALRWASELDGDPLQRVSAMDLRRIARLQLGDVQGAEYFRHKAELLSVHAPTTQMFSNTIVVELVLHAVGGELLGIKQLADRIAPIADRCPSWEPYRALARGYYERLRADAPAARRAFERCLQLCAPGPDGHVTHAWPLATAGLAETLLDLGDYDAARRIAHDGDAHCREQSVQGLRMMVMRALALAEAKLGQHARAAQLLETAIETARSRAVTGLQLGCLYEARAFVAIESKDPRAVEHFARMAAREYRYGFGSSLGARCERLLEAAALRNPLVAQPWAAWGPAANTQHRPSPGAEVSRVMAGAEHAEGRAERALRLLCESHGTSAGHLVLATVQGLRVAASYGIDPPEAALLELAHECLHSDLRQREDVTRVRGDTNVRYEPETRVVWTDAQGHAFEPRVLHCMLEGKPACAGVALFLQPVQPGPPHTRDAQFANALSAYLIATGETPGVNTKR